MTKKEYCIGRPIIACSSCFGGLVKFIFYGIDDYAYLVTGIWNGKKSYHRLKIYYGMNSAYIRLFGRRCPLSAFIRA